jgi:hypothetical protein
MATLTGAQFETKYNDSSTGLFKTGQSGGIGSDDMRTLVTDLKDSVFNATTNTGVIRLAERRITTAEILALNSTPITLVSALENICIVPLAATIHLDYGTAAYATNTTLRFFIGTRQVLNDNSTLLTAVADRFCIITPNDIELTPANFSYEPLKLTVLTGDPTAGDGEIYVRLTYTIHSVDPDVATP